MSDPKTSVRSVELRKDGVVLTSFVDAPGDGPSARIQAERAAQALFANLSDKDKKTVSIGLSGPVELLSSEGPCGTFQSEAEAKKAIDKLRPLLEQQRALAAKRARGRRIPPASALTFEVRRLA